MMNTCHHTICARKLEKELVVKAKVKEIKEEFNKPRKKKSK